MHLAALYFKRSWLAVLLATGLGAGSGLTAAALLAVVNGALATPWSASTVWTFVFLCVLRLGFGLGAHVLMVRLAQSAIYQLRMDLCSRIVHTPLPHLEQLGTHRLMASFTGDIESVARVAINIPYFLVNVVVLAGCLAYLGWMSVPIAVGMIACFGVGVLSYLGPVIWANRRLRVAREYEDQMHDAFQGVVRGTKELKLHEERRGAFFRDRLHANAESVRHHNVTGITVYAAAANWNRLLFFVYVGVLLFVFPVETSASAVQLAGYLLVVLYMMAPLEAIMNTLPHLAQANVALRKVQELDLSLPSEEHRANGDTSPRFDPSGWQQLRLRGAVYRHRTEHETDESSFILGPIDLTLHRGEVVYLTGGNGSGKTTLVKVLASLYPLDTGEAVVDGEAVTPSSLRAYRQFFSVVLADYHLFDDLAAGSRERLDEQAAEYLKWLRLEGKLNVRDGRLSTTRLSQGQRKRLALLAALLEDRPFYVLDEWAADQEPAFRESFYREIIPSLQARGKTVVVVTHDDRYFHLADRLIVMDGGKIASDVRTRGAGKSTAGKGRYSEDPPPGPALLTQEKESQ